MKMRYEFSVVIAGDGNDKESAWIDAVEHFALDCGNPPEIENKDGGNAECFKVCNNE
jgi:hypothetical protein